jgi:hypothetical protein
MEKGMKMKRDLIKVERRLQDVLKPVTPRMEFVTELRIKLDEEMVKRAKTKKVQTGLLVAGGLVSLVLMVVTIIRSLTKWPEIIKSISKNLPKQRKRQQAASA